MARQINGNGIKDLLAGGVCPVAGRHYFFYEGRIPPWWSHSRYESGGHIPPFPVCSAAAGGGPCACGYLYCGAHSVPRINTCVCMEWNDRM